MNVKLLYTPFGILIGDVAEKVENDTVVGYQVTELLSVIFSEKGFMLQDIYIGTAENENVKETYVQASQVLGSPKEPHVAIRNEYSKTVGGIQLV